MKHKLSKTTIFLLTALLVGCQSADNKSNILDKPVLLEEVILKSIELPDKEPLQSLNRIYLVAYDEDGEPVCNLYKQRIHSLDWVNDSPVAKYDVDYENSYQCPEKD